MPVFIGLMIGFAFGVASAFANRLWGTVLACIPVAGWFVFLAIAFNDGLSRHETLTLCYALFGMIIGLLVGQTFDRQRRRPGRRTHD